MTSGLRIAVGIFLTAAVFTATPAAYPPRPTTAAGLRSRSTFRTRSLVSRQLLKNLSRPPMVRTGGTIGWGMNSNPLGPRMTRSISRCVQRNNGVQSGSIRRSDSATAMPGYRCPPVPPPAKRMVLPESAKVEVPLRGDEHSVFPARGLVGTDQIKGGQVVVV